MYSSTTKNWFHTHPLFTRSSDEAPSSCLTCPEIVPLVLEAPDLLKLQQHKRPSVAKSVQARTLPKNTILTLKKELYVAHVWTQMVYFGGGYIPETPEKTLKAFQEKKEKKNLKVNPWDHKSI